MMIHVLILWLYATGNDFIENENTIQKNHISETSNFSQCDIPHIFPKSKSCNAYVNEKHKTDSLDIRLIVDNILKPQNLFDRNDGISREYLCPYVADQSPLKLECSYPLFRFKTGDISNSILHCFFASKYFVDLIRSKTSPKFGALYILNQIFHLIQHFPSISDSDPQIYNKLEKYLETNSRLMKELKLTIKGPTAIGPSRIQIF